ncbi:methylmalonyl-CoA decarboxylase, partial [bacterium]|nr:methylmalonyl-CoA decarboxylase [bacterium]
MEVEGFIGTVTLANTEKRNALSAALVEDLVAALDELQERKVRAIILRAPAGSKVWSAGHDVRELPVSGRDPLA